MDLEEYRIKQCDQLSGPRCGLKGPRRHKGGAWFLKGPIPGEWLGRAAKLPGRALHVGLALWFLAGVEKCRTVKPTWRAWERFGVSPKAGRRGLAALRREGLVTVEQSIGRCPLVTIEDVEADENS